MLHGSLALCDYQNEHLNYLATREWQVLRSGKFLKNTHSDRLPIEIDHLLKCLNKSLSDIKFLTVGTGPGRWTAVRSAMIVIRSLSFALKIPVYTINSLRICAEDFISQQQDVFVAINAFKNQVYFLKLQSDKELDGIVTLISFVDWCQFMEKEILLNKNKKILCLGDLNQFYKIPKTLINSLYFKEAKAQAKTLAKLLWKQKQDRTPQSWSQIQANYLRSAL